MSDADGPKVLSPLNDANNSMMSFPSNFSTFDHVKLKLPVLSVVIEPMSVFESFNVICFPEILP